MKRSMDDIYRDRVLSNANEIELSCLAHHGILGQKWGIRRYQNKDGTLTSAGKKHYENKIKRSINKADQRAFKDIYKNTDHSYSDARHSNTNKVRSKMFNDPEYVKANKQYMDAYSKKEQFDSDTYIRYGEVVGGPRSNELPKSVRTKGERINREYQNSLKAENLAFKNALKKYESELCSAALKDIGEKDTETGRKIIKDIYTKRRGEDTWWYL